MSRSAVLGVLAVLAVALLGLATTSTSAAFTARITNTTNTTASAPFFTCSGALTAPAAADTYLVYPLAETAGTVADDIGAGGRDGLYTANGVTYGATGPCGRDNPNRAITLNGSTGAVSGPNATLTNPNPFTVQIWFRTTTTRGGKLIGFGNLRTGSSANYDRHLYMTDTGQVVFGVFPNAVRSVRGPATYNDGLWHLATATLSAAGMALYVDGALVATDPNTTTAQSYNGFVRIGFDNLTGWPDRPTSNFFAGSLAYAAVYRVALTPTQVAEQHAAGR